MSESHAPEICQSSKPVLNNIGAFRAPIDTEEGRKNCYILTTCEVNHSTQTADEMPFDKISHRSFIVVAQTDGRLDTRIVTHEICTPSSPSSKLPTYEPSHLEGYALGELPPAIVGMAGVEAVGNLEKIEMEVFSIMLSKYFMDASTNLLGFLFNEEANRMLQQIRNLGAKDGILKQTRM